MKQQGENNPTADGKQGGADRQGLGRAGERLAAQALRRKGYRILAHNYRCIHGEIDLIAEDEHELIFVEVKTRRGDAFGLPEEALTARKQRSLVRVASYYLAVHACAQRSWRIDVVAVQLSTGGKLEEIRIYRHAISG
jgi:putative endonuclease